MLELLLTLLLTQVEYDTTTYYITSTCNIKAYGSQYMGDCMHMQPDLIGREDETTYGRLLMKLPQLEIYGDIESAVLNIAIGGAYLTDDSLYAATAGEEWLCCAGCGDSYQPVTWAKKNFIDNWTVIGGYPIAPYSANKVSGIWTNDRQWVQLDVKDIILAITAWEGFGIVLMTTETDYDEERIYHSGNLWLKMMYEYKPDWCDYQSWGWSPPAVPYLTIITSEED